MNVDQKMAEMALRVRTMEKEMRQLAEECAELTQASLKYERACEDDNVDYQKALRNLAEEIGDVENVIAGVKAMMNIKHPEFTQMINDSREYKAYRWALRIKKDKGIIIDLKD